MLYNILLKTVGMDDYPAQPSGYGRFSTNLWNAPPAKLFVARWVGSLQITVTPLY